MVVRTADDSIWTATFNSSGVFNNDWAPISGATPSVPALAWDATASELCLVIRASNNSVWFATFNSSGSFNNDWVSIPGSTPSSPGIAYLPSIGYLGIVVRASDDTLWEMIYWVLMKFVSWWSQGWSKHIHMSEKQWQDQRDASASFVYFLR